MKNMKAYVLHGINNIEFEDVELPRLKPEEVLVQVKAAGICGSDIPRIYQTGAHVHPLIPGHEFSGIITDAGDLAIKIYADKYGSNEKIIGKRVGVFPLIPCCNCIPCKNKKFEMCRNYNYLGSRCNGGFAEYVAVPVNNIIELPDNVTYEEAAMLEPMAVAVHAIRQSGIKSTDKVVVCGLGTIGLLIVMFLKNMGIDNILVIGNKEYQKNSVQKLGINEKYYHDGRKTDTKEWIINNTDGNGVDVFFECIGKTETISMGVDVMAPSGNVIYVGNPYSDIVFEKQVYWKILRNQLRINGTWNSSFTGEADDDWHYVIDCLNKGTISPVEFISQRFSIEKLYKGFEIMKDKSEDYVKIMGIFE